MDLLLAALDLRDDEDRLTLADHGLQRRRRAVDPQVAEALDAVVALSFSRTRTRTTTRTI